MIVVKSLSETHHISNTTIRELVQQRINDLGGDTFDASTTGYFLVVEDGDTLAALSAQVGFPILCNRMTGIRYDQAEFTPSLEFVELIGEIFDAVWILDDSGFGVEIFLQIGDGVDPDLLAMLKHYALRGAP
jgi:hypothetical protein